ncbi:glycosyltransferase [Acinetobacter junii]|uniref:glycosyltransferase family 2 protein n=1 Tax=Acinetobacter junii TaxID=40215 RepID=UPI0032B3DCB6
MEKNNQPLVSIVIPCYNHEQFVQDCIQSVIDQTYENIELIIIDDGSKDNSVLKIQEMVRKCQNRFKRFEFRYRPNKGLSATLNEAIDWCCGEYFSVIASDDMMISYKTDLQIKVFQNNSDILGVFGNILLINDKGEKIKSPIIKERDYVFADVYRQNYYLPAPTQMLKMVEIRKVGGFIDGMIIEDWYIYLKLLENGGKMYLLKENLCFYRYHCNNTSGNFKKMVLGRFQVINQFSSNKATDDIFIKQCWDNAFYTVKLSFWKSIKIMIKSFFSNLRKIIYK